MCEIIRNESGDLAEDVELIDAFYNPKKDRQSLCYRISYRSHERNLLNSVIMRKGVEAKEIDAIQLRVRESLAKTLGVELRYRVCNNQQNPQTTCFPLLLFPNTRTAKKTQRGIVIKTKYETQWSATLLVYLRWTPFRSPTASTCTERSPRAT